MDMRYAADRLDREAAAQRIGGLVAAQRLAPGGANEVPQEAMAGRALDVHLNRLRHTREHALHLEKRMSAILARLRGQEVAGPSEPRDRMVNASSEPPTLHAMSDTTVMLADTLGAIDRAVSELESIA